MRIVAIEVENFGVFSGRHRISLVARNGGQDRYSRVLIVGHNGSGKTTLFRAVDIALYGPASIARRLSRQTYQDCLRGLVHRETQGDSLDDDATARVCVDLEYARNGTNEVLRFERSWRCRADSVTETASVGRLTPDGNVEDIVEHDVVAELLPPGLRRMMLVDVAFVDELTQALQSPGALERILRELAGLRLVERLQADLLTVDAQARRGAPHRQEAELLQTWSKRVREIDDSLEETRSRVEESQRNVIEIERATALKERELVSAGGELATSRPALRETLLAAETELEQTVAELRDLCHGTLPFSLCSSLCLDLANRLDDEANAGAVSSLAAFADKWLNEVSSDLTVDRRLRELVPQQEMRDAVVERFKDRASSSLAHRIEEPRHAPIHDLSKHEREALGRWIAEAVGVIPSRARGLAATLNRLESTRDITLQELDRTLDENGLRVVQGGLRTLREDLMNTSADLVRAQDQLDALEGERLRLLSQIRAVEEDLAQTAEQDRVGELIHRTRLALADFEGAQLEQRAVEFSDALVATFNSLSRKQSLLTSAVFDPATRVFTMNDVEGSELDISKLSTGELQLYSMAVLESLRTTADKHYPLLVDTPLAYLDELHRETLLSEVLLGGDRQVVLFATDQEMDSRALQRWLPRIDCAYRLDFDTSTRSTSVVTLGRNNSPCELSPTGRVA